MKKKLVAALMFLTMAASTVGCGGNAASDASSTTTTPSTSPSASASSGSDTSSGGSAEVVPGEVQKGGTLTVSLPASPRYLDPVLYTGTYEGQIINAVHDKLVEYSDDVSEIRGSLAESWTVSDDGLTYVFKIREGVKFQPGTYQDGRELTAEDIAYSLNRSHELSVSKRLDMLKVAEVTGPYEVTCTLDAPNASFLTALTDAGNAIVCKEEVEGWGDDYGSHLVGTGPFSLKTFELDQETVLVANKDYWAAEPNIDGLVFKVVADSTQAANALATGAVDLATGLTGESIKMVRDMADVDIVETPGLHVAYIYFNQQEGPTADIRVREALIKAIDIDELTAAIYEYDEAARAYLPLPPGSWGYDADLEGMVPEYDVEGAKALLAEAGYPDGFSMELYVSNTPTRVRLATLVQAYLKANVNVDVNINATEWGTFSATAASGKADVYGMSWTWYPDPFFFLNKLFHTESIGTNGNGQRFISDEVDSLLDEALLVTDQDARASLYKQATKIVMEQYPGIYYANENVTYGVSSAVQDFVQRPDGTLLFVTPTRNVWLSK